ncbi:MAG TPA: hypothetical protein DDZ80_08545 [Cyanobacteria bacterium UBA8803]|nr:hypothetical protein [Cyanobacteria bacterium UBA9273]HBL58549.1 hypothetical protein [Cyanobacteria bacterium UBA8803]
MPNPSFFKKLATAIFLSILIVSCQGRVTKAPEQGKSTQQNVKPNIFYGELVLKEESDYIMIPVRLSREDQSNRGNILGSSSYEVRKNIFDNIIFYRKADGVSHLLLDKKARISSFDFLEQKKPLARFVLYKIIENDTNQDGELTEEDATIGYLSDLAGKNLQQITPNNSQLLSSTVVQSVGAIFAKIIKDSDGDRKFTERDETAFIKVNLDNPGIGTEIISDQIKQQIKS